MGSLFSTLISSSGFMPHGHCYLWTPGLLWLHVVSDALITLSYYSIPITLAWFVRRRHDIDFGWMFLCFAVFILACGTSHLMEIWNVWHGDYWESGVVKAITAAASVPTAILLARLMPRALELPSPSALRLANENLRVEADARRSVDKTLRETNENLERRVAERTAELEAKNVELRNALGEVQRLAAIVGSSHDAIIGKDLAGIITSWNAAAERVFGYSAQESIGQPITRLIPPGLLDEEEAILARLKRGEVVEQFDSRRLRKDGTLIDVSITVSPIKDAAGRVTGASKVARDVTERRAAEAALRERDLQIHAANRLLAETVNGMSEACFMLDARWRFTFVNDRCETLFRRRREEVLGGTIWSRFPQLIGTPSEAQYRRALSTHASVFFETCSPVAERWLDVRLFPTEDGLVAFLLDIQERKEAEQAMAASETRYRRLFESAQDGILILNAETAMVIDVNPFLMAMLGYTHQQFLGKGLWELGFFDDAEANAENFVELKRKGYIRYENLPLKTADGRGIEVEFVSNVYLVNDTRVIQCNIRDVTKRRAAEAAMRASEERMRLATEASSVGIWEWNIVTNEIHWDAEMFRIYGVAPTEDGLVPYTTWSGAVVADALREQEEALQDTVRRAGRGTREFCIHRTTDGECRSIQAVDAVRLNVQGQVEWVVGTNLDITERQRGEDALRAGEERFRMMANLMPQLAWIGRADGYIEWYNDRFHHYTGTTPAQVAGGGWPIMHDPEGLSAILAEWSVGIAAGQPFEMAFPIRGVDGKFRAFLTRVQPIMDSAGRVTQWFGTNTDVETLKETEEKIRALNASLEQRVVERTEELEAANKELETFSYSISHDLRAPLRAIDGYSQAVIEDYASQLPEEGQRYLQTVREEAQNMGQLIDDLLTFARLGRAPINKRELDTTGLVHSVLNGFKTEQQERRVDVQIGELTPCQGDAALLRQVWINLISNAFKYTRKRESAVIEIGCRSTPAGTEYFVRDNGAGFDMAYAHKLFGVFQRLHLAEDYEGTGVGLALVQRIVLRHGGRIWAEAAADRGATFFFNLEPEPKS